MTAPGFPPPQAAKNRLLITLVLDTSQSMGTTTGAANGGTRPIAELNRALKQWRDDLQRRPNLRRIAEIALVTFGDGGVRVVDPTGRGRDVSGQPFVTIDEFNPPDLSAGGFSPMVQAIRRALAVTDARRESLSAAGVGMAYRSLIYLITDGAPTDEQGNDDDRWRDLAPELRRQEDDRARGILFTCIAVGDADRQVLGRLAPDSLYSVSDSGFTTVLNQVMKSIETSVKNGRTGSAKEIYKGIQTAIEDQDALRAWFQAQKGV